MESKREADLIIQYDADINFTINRSKTVLHLDMEVGAFTQGG